MPLRGTLFTALIALALTAMCAVNAPAESFLAAQSEDQAAQPQPPVVPGADAIARYQGLIVAEIHWPDIPAAVDQKRWRELIPQQVGQPLDRELIRESIHKLHQTGRFADIRVEAEPATGGKVILSFFTTPNYFVGSVIVHGAPTRPSAGQIVNASKFQLGELFTPDQARARPVKHSRPDARQRLLPLFDQR